MHIINPVITERVKQIVNGTILGGSSLVKSNGGKNYYLSMRSKSGNWLDYKSSELKIFSSHEPVTIEKTNRWHSLCYPYFTEIRNLFYENKRCLSQTALERLSDIAYMIWFVDSGIYKNKIITLNTNIWGEQGSVLIRDYFCSMDFHSDIIKERNYFRIQFNEKSSQMILKLISPHLPIFFKINL